MGGGLRSDAEVPAPWKRMAKEETLAGDLEPVQSSNLQASPTDAADLSFLRPALEAAGYSEAAMRALIELRRGRVADFLR